MVVEMSVKSDTAFLDIYVKVIDVDSSVSVARRRAPTDKQKDITPTVIQIAFGSCCQRYLSVRSLYASELSTSRVTS